MARILEFAGAIPLSVVIVDKNAQILELNGAGAELLRLGRFFAEQNGVLTAAEKTAALHRSIANIANASGTCMAMRISRPGAPPSTLLLVGMERPEDGAKSLAVAVVISDPEFQVSPDETTLRELFGFTHAEAVVASHLMKGEGPVAIAGYLHTSVNTVRTHVKKLFAKTETSRQGELVWVLLSSVAQLRAQLLSTATCSTRSAGSSPGPRRC